MWFDVISIIVPIVARTYHTSPNFSHSVFESSKKDHDRKLLLITPHCRKHSKVCRSFQNTTNCQNKLPFGDCLCIPSIYCCILLVDSLLALPHQYCYTSSPDNLNGRFRILDWRYLPYIRPFFRPKFQGISPQNMARNMVLTYLHQLDPGDLPFFSLRHPPLVPNSAMSFFPRQSARTYRSTWTSMTLEMMILSKIRGYIPGLVNVNKKRTGKIHQLAFWWVVINYFDWAIFNGIIDV